MADCILPDVDGRDSPSALRALLDGASGPIPVIGVHDPLSARRAAHAGAAAVFVTGRGVARAVFDERVVHVRAVDAEAYIDYVRLLCAATTAPVVVDAEDGFGDPVRTCRALERAGAAAVTLQDGDESGGFMTAERVSDAIAEVARSTRLVVVGRTDLLGTDRAEALARLRAYHAAGADLVMAGLSDVAEDTAPGSVLLTELTRAGGGALVVHTPDGSRFLPTSALPDGVRVVLVTAAVVDAATAVIDRTLHDVLHRATTTMHTGNEDRA